MFNFLRKNKVNINSISIPDFNWEPEIDNLFEKTWINPKGGGVLFLNFFDKAPDIPTVTDLIRLRNFYRPRLATGNGGLVEVELIELKGNAATQTIFKFPKEPKGMGYISSFTIPFKKCSFVIKVQTWEDGWTGIRDTFVMTRLLGDKTLTLGKDGPEGWFADPYDKDFNIGVLMNKSEARHYDKDFPDHPLSQARKILTEIARKIEFSPEISKLQQFSEQKI